MPFGLPDALQEIVNAEEGYVAATGTLTFDQTKLPKVDWDNQQDTPDLTRIKARLKGKTLSKTGFTNPTNTSLILEIHCYGPWCAGATSNKNVLVFLQQTQDGFTLRANPCGGHVFYDPTRADLKAVEQCYLKGTCPKSEHR